MKSCDIIIPIYNAYNCLKPCIDSVIKYTNLKENRIILIDDKSPDERVLPLLEQYENGKSIILLKNDINMGFVSTVNKGMNYSKNDVLLLNSDTEVSKLWLDNIKECAYSSPMVASVTPLSNNATLVSAPNGLQVNDLPQKMSFDEYADLVNKISYKDYPELPTAHGFCMYIRREALDVVGYFDDETFKKGYGEENDFSYRCLENGFKHLLCDNVIIYHKESQSFCESKEQLKKENAKILESKYSFYVSQTENWCKLFPIRHICQNINYGICLSNKKQNILYLIHDFKEYSENVGGTTLHLYDLIKNLIDTYNVHILTPESGGYKLYSFFDEHKETIFMNCPTSNTKVPFYNKEYKKMLEYLVDSLNICLIHVHHLIGHYFDIKDVAHDKKINLVITLHDFYSYCPNINLLYENKKYCIGKDYDCNECILKTKNIKGNIIENWRREWQNLFNVCQEVFVPNQSLIPILEKKFEFKKITVIEHGLDVVKDNKILTNDKKKNVAFIGVLAPHKGLYVVKDLVKREKGLKFIQIGPTDDKKMKKSKMNYKYVGKYNRKDLPNIIKENNVDLICLLSIWPETFSYTLTEAIASGTPVLTFDIGALGNRIKRDNLGWTMPLESSYVDIRKMINNILNNKEEYKEKIDSIKKFKLKTTKEMTEEYIEIYASYIKKQLTNTKDMSGFIMSYSKSKESLDSAMLQWILSSRRWKLVSSITTPDFVKKIINR